MLLTLRIAEPGLQYVILHDASFHRTGFLLVIEDYLIDQKDKTKNLLSIILWFETFYSKTIEIVYPL